MRPGRHREQAVDVDMKGEMWSLFRENVELGLRFLIKSISDSLIGAGLGLHNQSVQDQIWDSLWEDLGCPDPELDRWDQ
jgi:hypothetical protein